MNKTIQRVANSEELIQLAAQEIAKVAREAIARNDRMSIALAGGSTPRGLYTFLASAEYQSHIPWDKVHFFWGDERHVPPDHQDSNYRMAWETLLTHIPIPATHIHRIQSELKSAGQAAEEYNQELKEHFQLQENEKPRFDVILLGMGPDGHTASLFPGTPAVHETKQCVVAPWVEKFETYRITMTPPVLNEAANIIFLVAGADKAETLKFVLEAAYEPDLYPAQIVNPPQGRLLWLVDQAAGSFLSPSLLSTP